MPGAAWQSVSARARALLAPTLPRRCPVCQTMITPGQAWDVGHVIPRAVRPDLANDPRNWRAEHASCNRAAGARATNRQRRGGVTFGWR